MSRAMYVGQDGYGIKDEGWAYVCVWGGVIIQFYLLLYMFEVNLHNKK